VRQATGLALYLLINTIMNRLIRFTFAVTTLAAALTTASAENGSVTGTAVIREMNLARQNPPAYAQFLEDLRAHFNGRFLVLPGQTRIYTREGLGAVDEAIRVLRSTKPIQPLTLSPGMCRGAGDHCAGQVGGTIGHGNPASRMNRYGTWTSAWGENISYGKHSARDIVLALIIDDGLPARKHRANILAAKFNYAGAAYGPHARYGSVCSIDFAGGYFERGQATTEPLIARNF
jgi:uncharacterized protein YkwD